MIIINNLYFINNNMDLRQLELYGLIKTVLYLAEVGSARKLDIRRDCELSSTTQMKVVEPLFNAGLIENANSLSEIKFQLSAKGKALLKKLKEIEEI